MLWIDSLFQATTMNLEKDKLLQTEAIADTLQTRNLHHHKRNRQRAITDYLLLGVVFDIFSD